jgi:methylated-DNA-protein-cysteine methyltransferase-like protein
MNASFSARVSRVIENLSEGEVVSYGEVAEQAGFPGAARAVGNLLRTTPGLPWWRVVTSEGRLVPGHETVQAERLRAEGIAVHGGRIAGGR